MPHVARHTDYMAAEVGTARLLEGQGQGFEAGSWQDFTLVFTAGRFGMDDTGSIRIVHRFASDMGAPQFADPAAPNYVTAAASNGAQLQLSYHPRLNLRPWGKCLTVAVGRGYLAPGDTITVRLGDRRGGSPGMRLQTFCEDRFEFRVLADVFATCNWALLPEQPWIRILPGAPAQWRAVLPTVRRAGEGFALSLRADDRWGNPSHLARGRFRLAASAPVRGLPESFAWPEGARSHRIEGLAAGPGDLSIALLDEAGRELARSNPLRLVEHASHLPFWADMHGQSEETIGTNSARRLAEYARDLAFLDAMCHQGNDFQITAAFWRDLNALAAEFTAPGRFVFFPGWEWSGNTALGGDRNVVLRREGGTLHRSCHALVEDLSDAETDALDVKALHATLRREGDALCLPHVGGRYADLRYAHDKALERSVEVHSDWGTFDWLLEDAFAVGGRVGIAANSDGHKGRHGASHPGASLFGAYGGLTCYLAEELSREALWDAMLWRRQYATTGAARVHCDAWVTLSAPAALHRDDPALGGAPVGRTERATLGNILTGVRDEAVEFGFEILAGSPVERVEIRNRTRLLEVFRPYAAAGPGRRIRVLWEGSEYRGRGRETLWRGEIALSGNAWRDARPINRFNLDRRFEPSPQGLVFDGVTTGGFMGVEAMLEDPRAGTLSLRTNLVEGSVPIAELGLEDRVWEAGGLGRRIRAFRLPDANPHRAVRHGLRVPLRRDEDNALFIRATLEDGNVLWSSPIYLITA
ncbi:DUF3604 domain-containing protein [Crenalkalicoccus roseus]|uniref:DUF3604 domain-containing protein n=1 Tax=Crenalkalicoccus roseus TaxID=1485588 RepID=UPI001081707E|nr:DUF3604 domain-containing protein [Crenalkalicoccus roseus]